MKTLALKDFFNKINYDWKKDKDKITTICYYTKTRVNPKIKEVKLTFGTEQTFLVKSIAEWINAESFFEIGTGRGTACYAISLVPSIKEIHTVDILKFNQKFPTAIGHRPATVSLSDIRDMIPFKEKSKVNFHHRKRLANLQEKFKGHFDLCFIDGDHTDKKIILEDFVACKNMLKDGGIILWDDYDPDRFAVKEIVDDLLNKDNNLNAILVEQRGHLFPDKPAENNIGVVIMKNDEFRI